MATNRTAGTRVLHVEIDAELRDYLDRFATLRKEKKRTIVERALQNEFESPPAIPEKKPLPDLADVSAPARRRRRKSPKS